MQITVFLHTGLNVRHPFPSIHMCAHVSECKVTLAVQILNDQEARFNSADLNIAYKMNVDEYQKLCPYSGELEANWGKAPGNCPVLPHAVPCCAVPCCAVPCCAVLRHAMAAQFCLA